MYRKSKLVNRFLAVVCLLVFSFERQASADIFDPAIGDFVWEDTNQNGIQDPDELGVPDVIVKLFECGTSNLLIDSTQTDITGRYGFFFPPAGTYFLQFVLPAGYAFSPKDQGTNDNLDSDVDPTTGTTTICTTVTYDTEGFPLHQIYWDAGIYQQPQATIGDLVFNDLNANGVQDGGLEVGVDGVTVELFTSGNVLAGTTTTSGGGLYSFTVPPGDYYVKFSNLPPGFVFSPSTASGASDLADSDANAGTGQTNVTTLVAGENDSTWDAGIYQPGTIGDLVFNDLNANGVQDGGLEVGVDGVTVELFTSGNVLAGTTTTSGGGLYSFTVPPGDYYVKFSNLPPGFVFSPSTASGASDPADSDANTGTGQTDVTTLVAGENDPTWDAGVYQPATTECVPDLFTFSGNSSTDGQDGNIRTFTTPSGVAVKVSAFSRIKSSGAWSTAWAGLYGSGLGVTDSSEGDGSSNRHTVDNIDRDNYLLFEFSEPVIVNRVFLGYVVSDSDLTAWIGNFADPFNNHLTLSDGLLAGFGFSEENTTTSTGSRWADLNSGEVVGNALVIAAWLGDTTPEDQFKLNKLDICRPNQPVLASVGNFVWNDTNANGMQDSGEPGVDGVVVSLFRCSDNGLVGTTTTTGGGLYSFTVSPGDYYVKFSNLPPGFVFSPSTASGASDPADSDANPGTGKTDCTTLVSGENDLTWDAGIYKPVTTECVPETFVFSGNSGTDGANGNIRTFTTGSGVSVKVSAFSRVKSTGSWSTAWAGLYGSGLGVTDSSEGDGSSNRHTVDNIDRDNYLLFEFSEAVIVDRAFLGYVVSDSDLTAWIGNFADPFNNHLTLSDGLLAGFGFSEENTTTSTGTRWADLNSGQVVGNALVIAAWLGDTTPEDQFKLNKLDFCKPASAPPPCLVSVSGAVVRDCDANGSLNGEQGLGGFTVQLKTSTGSLVTTVVTSANGSYSFENVAMGSYVVAVVPPANYALTKDPDSTFDGKTSITLSGCLNQTGVNFGYTGTAPAVNLVMSGPSTAKSGDTIVYTFTASNTGNTCLYGGMRVVSPLLGGEIWHLTPVAPGESFTFTRTYLVKATDSSPLVNTATVYGDPPGNLPNVSKTVSWSVTLTQPSAAPTGLSGTPGNGECLLSWDACAGSTSYNLKRSSTQSGPYTVIKSGLTTTSWTDGGLVNGTPYYYKVSCVKDGLQSADSSEVCVIPTAGLPSPWSSKDVGTVGETGAASYSGGKFTVVGSGDDIWNTADDFRYAYQSASGNCTIIARVVSVQGTHAWAKAGVMIRENLSAGSKHASTFVTPSNGVAFQSRGTSGGTSANINTTGLSAPYWVKIVRSGDIFTSYRSSTGGSWITIGSTTITMGSNVFIGLGVTSHLDGSLCGAVFDNVSVTP